MSNFKVGDVCEIIRSLTLPEAFGMECEVVGFVGGSKSVHIKISSLSGLWRIEPHCLRLKRPPSKDEFTAGEWSLCPWSPYRVGETS